MIKILKYVTILNFSMNFILLKKLFPNKVIESGLNRKSHYQRVIVYSTAIV